jgi:hypothetical protein
VTAAARNFDLFDALKLKYGGRLVPLALDVGNRAAVDAAVGQAHKSSAHANDPHLLAKETLGRIGAENTMEYATLGNTGLLVSKLCFGTMTFGDGKGLFKAISAVGQAEADELVKTSIDGGI